MLADSKEAKRHIVPHKSCSVSSCSLGGVMQSATGNGLLGNGTFTSRTCCYAHTQQILMDGLDPVNRERFIFIHVGE